jgi:hypothetical protein
MQLSPFSIPASSLDQARDPISYEHDLHEGSRETNVEGRDSMYVAMFEGPRRATIADEQVTDLSSRYDRYSASSRDISLLKGRDRHLSANQITHV